MEKTKQEIDRLIEEEGDIERFEYRGLRCYIVRNPGLGFLLGYVEAPCDFDWEDVEKTDVHGGVTFVGRIGLTHFPNEPREANVRVIGFDCGHFGDYAPYFPDSVSSPGMEYRSMRYVENECKKLADQLLVLTED